MKNKKNLLKILKEDIVNDKKLPFLRANLVFGEGKTSSSIMFIGEAPGFSENIEKRPFVGKSGKLLTLSIENIGWKREDVYITNIIKRQPPKNRDPKLEEIKKYSSYLRREIEIINPKIIVTLGRFATKYFISDSEISRDQGKIFKVDNYIVFPMFHPASTFRSLKNSSEFKKNFKRLPLILKRIKNNNITT